MTRLLLQFVVVVFFFTITSGSSNDTGCAEGSGQNSTGCKYVPAIYHTLCDAYKDQPLYAVVTTGNKESLNFDNVCFTLSPIKNTTGFLLYQSSVLRNGTNVVNAFVTQDTDIGVFTAASPSCTYTDTVFGEAGCDTYLLYRCYQCGACPGTGRGQGYDPIIGISPVNAPIDKCCLRRFKEIARASGIPEQDYFPLPMALPTQCVII